MPFPVSSEHPPSRRSSAARGARFEPLAKHRAAIASELVDGERPTAQGAHQGSSRPADVHAAADAPLRINGLQTQSVDPSGRDGMLAVNDVIEHLPRRGRADRCLDLERATNVLCMDAQATSGGKRARAGNIEGSAIRGGQRLEKPGGARLSFLAHLSTRRSKLNREVTMRPMTAATPSSPGIIRWATTSRTSHPGHQLGWAHSRSPS